MAGFTAFGANCSAVRTSNLSKGMLDGQEDRFLDLHEVRHKHLFLERGSKEDYNRLGSNLLRGVLRSCLQEFVFFQDIAAAMIRTLVRSNK